MKEDIVSAKDQEFMKKLKLDYEKMLKVFKFKNTKNKGALKSQRFEVFRYSIKRMASKQNFNIQIGNTLIKYIYNIKEDTYNIIVNDLRKIRSSVNAWGR